MTADEQRFQPMMQDNCGNLFWTMIDSNSDVTVYKQHLDQNSWNVLAHDRKELADFVTNLEPTNTMRRKSERIYVNLNVNTLLDKFRGGIDCVERD